MKAQVDADRKVMGRLTLAVVFTGFIFFVELAGGFITNSLALLSDSAHVLMDVLALALSLFAIHISRLPPTETRTYGLHRAEVVVAFVNGFTLLLVSLFIFYKAWGRLVSPPEVNGLGVLAVASLGLAVNLMVAFWLKGHAAHDLNVKSAFFHVVGDAVASVGVIVAALVIHYTGWLVVDPLVSVFIGTIIVAGAVRIINESTHILLEGVPREVDLGRVVEDLSAIEGVSGVHSLHIWSICHNVHALSAHVDIDEAHRARQAVILREANERLAQNHRIFYTTIQVECSECESGETLRAIVHREHEH
ncbi:MAG: cation diffusion facilitator family transporter [Thermodesulfobacteriota bacterium]